MRKTLYKQRDIRRVGVGPGREDIIHTHFRYLERENKVYKL